VQRFLLRYGQSFGMPSPSSRHNVENKKFYFLPRTTTKKEVYQKFMEACTTISVDYEYFCRMWKRRVCDEVLTVFLVGIVVDLVVSGRS
jgi:hypothetical protein